MAATVDVPGDERSFVSVFALREGDCIIGHLSGQLTEVEQVSCEEPHDFAVYREALVDASITEFDEVAIATYSEELCRSSLIELLAAYDDRGISFVFLEPTSDSWNQPGNPDRLVTCLGFDEGELLTEPLSS